MDTLELDMAEWQTSGFVGKVRQLLRTEGCVLLRRAITPQRCHAYESMLDSTFSAFYKLIEENGIDFNAIEQSDSQKGGVHSIAWNLKIGQVLPAWFEQANPGFAMFDLIGDISFHSLMHGIFRGNYAYAPTTHARRISPLAKHHFSGWQKPNNFHLDAQFHTPDQFGLNFWSPLNDCGEEAPGLQVIPGPAEPVIAESGYQQETQSFYIPRLENINNHGFLDQVDDGRIFRPVMQAGDVLLFHNWTLHATYCTPRMEKTRKSFELRVNGDQFSMPD